MVDKDENNRKRDILYVGTWSETIEICIWNERKSTKIKGKEWKAEGKHKTGKYKNGRKRKICEKFFMKKRKMDKIYKKIEEKTSNSVQKGQAGNGKKLRKC